MKKPSDNIFRLVQSMTPAEKRYFKRHYASDQNITTELFDFINTLSAYDEEMVKSHFGSKVAKNLKVYKIQLNDLILKSLVSHHQKKNITSKIRVGLEETEILIEKQLYDQAGDRLSKAKKLAIKYEEFTYLIEIAMKEFRLFHMRHDRVGISQHPIFKEMEEYLEQLKHHRAFSELGHQLMDLTRQRNFEMLTSEEHDDLDRLISSDLLQIAPERLSFRSQLSRNALLSFLYRLLEDKEGSFRVRKDNVDLFQKYVQFKEAMPFNYIGVMRNYLNYCASENLREEAGVILEEAYRFIAKHKEVEIHLIHFYLIELELLFSSGQFLQIIQELEPKVKKHIKKHKIGEERILSLIYPLLVVSRMIHENYTESQAFLRELEAIKPKLPDARVTFFQLLELINHYESGDEFLIDRLISSWQRKKKGTDRSLITTPFYDDCLEFFKNVVRKPFDKIELAKKLYAKLPDYENSKDRVCESFFHYKLDWWLKAITIRKRFSETMKTGNFFLSGNKSSPKKDA